MNGAIRSPSWKGLSSAGLLSVWLGMLLEGVLVPDSPPSAVGSATASTSAADPESDLESPTERDEDEQPWEENKRSSNAADKHHPVRCFIADSP